MSLSADANFRLCRKAKAAKSLSKVDDPLLSGTFLKQAIVDDYISSHGNSTSSTFADGDTVCCVSFECILYLYDLALFSKFRNTVVNFVLGMHSDQKHVSKLWMKQQYLESYVAMIFH